MKSIRVHHFGEPEVLRFDEVPEPQTEAGQVLISVHAIGVNPVDTYIRAGKYGPRSFPYTPGSDAAGIVEAIGEGVTRVKPGDRVYTASTISGAYAQKAICSQQTVHPLPSNATFAQGAALGVPYATAHRGLFHRGALRSGESVLIHGASGSVGIAAVQFARPLGCKIIGTAGSQEGQDIVADQGADFVLNHRANGYLAKVMELTEGKGVDLILEMAAHINLGKDLEVLAKHGRVIVIGSRGRVELDPRDTMKREADIRGMSLMNVTEEDLLVIHAAIIAGVENRTLKPVIAIELPLAEAARAHRLVLQDGARGKIVVVP